MADNPIKHDDIIQPGNPFDEAIKGINVLLTQFDKLNKDIKKSATEWVKYTSKQNVSTKEGQANLKKAAKATSDLSVQERELLKIKQQLEREQAKLNTMNSKEYRDLIKAKEATKAKNAELRRTAKAMQTGVKTTNTWSKAMGSFAAKFNTIGNVLSNVITGMARGISRTVKEFTGLEKIVRSNQLTSDKWDKTMGRLKGSFDAFNRAIAMGNVTTLGDDMRRAADAAEDYIAALDALGDTQRALNIQNARARREVKELQEIYNDTSQSTEKRLAAATKAQSILNDLQIKQQEIAQQYKDEEIARVQSTYNLTEEQTDLYRRFIENYGLLTDDQVTNLQGLESAQSEAFDEVGGFKKILGAVIAVQTKGNILIDQSGEKTEAYSKAVKELSDTFGFNLGPVMNAIVSSTDEQRDAIGNTIIAYEDQIGATQRLINANAAMLGSIKNQTKVQEEGSTEIVKIKNREVEDLLATDEFYFQAWYVGATDRTKQEEEEGKTRLKKLKELWVKEAEDFKAKEQQKTEEARAEEDARFAIINNSLNAARDFSNSLQALNDVRTQNEIKAAEGNEEKIEEIRKKSFERNKRLSTLQTLIDGAAAVVATFKNAGGFPLGLGLAIAQAAITGVQLAAINAQEYAEGGHGLLGDKGGRLSGPSHARGGVNLGEIGTAEGGEYFGIINKRMTQRYSDQLPAIFDSINNGRFHDVFSKANITLNSGNIFKDPYVYKMYKLMEKQGNTYQDSDGNQVIEYPTGKKRIIRNAKI